ncbi:hypothetical protein [Streptomyces sp.]|uniref:hypothetical protein n=1 Tax=Streptomyces sp. TaxID=1931 RepID=UPI002D79F0A3|nr:hypothetical protein [Streptomyces sp.]HET6357728.1 hypothetical protein [Streptomyces sp.]
MVGSRELLVVADHVVVEDRDIAASGLDIEVAEQSGADQSLSGPADHPPHRRGGHRPQSLGVHVLEQVGQRLAPDLFVQVVTDADRNDAVRTKSSHGLS